MSSEKVLITTKIEHKSLLKSAKKYSHVRYVDLLPSGAVSLDSLEKLLRSVNSSNFLVSIMSANNETGVINRLGKIGKLVKQYGGIFHTDVTQLIGKIDSFKPVDLGIHSFSMSFHKLGGIIGCGLLYIDSEKIKCSNPLIPGSQQSGLRGGTMNPGMLMANCESLIINQKYRVKKSKKMQAKKIMIMKALDRIDGMQIINNMDNTLYLPGTILFSTGDYCSVKLINKFGHGVRSGFFSAEHIIILGVGSACNKGEYSYVMNELNGPKNVVRISLSDSTTRRECKILINSLARYNFEEE